jgi:hypothetical protein
VKRPELPAHCGRYHLSQVIRGRLGNAHPCHPASYPAPILSVQNIIALCLPGQSPGHKLCVIHDAPPLTTLTCGWSSGFASWRPAGNRRTGQPANRFSTGRPLADSLCLHTTICRPTPKSRKTGHEAGNRPPAHGLQTGRNAVSVPGHPSVLGVSRWGLGDEAGTAHLATRFRPSAIGSATLSLHPLVPRSLRLALDHLSTGAFPASPLPSSC